MSNTSSTPIPPGWYPDPSGDRQWRVWTGTQWSELTRSYGDSAPTSLIASLPLIGALHRLTRYGILAFFTGLGLIVGALAHTPGTAHPTPQWFAAGALGAGTGLALIGWASFCVAAKELDGHWTAWAVVPGINVLEVNGLLSRRFVGRSPVRSVVAEVILLSLFIAQAHTQPWLGVALGLVALEHMRLTSALLEQLTGPTTPAVSPAS